MGRNSRESVLGDNNSEKPQ